eukprot:g48344.t1
MLRDSLICRTNDITMQKHLLAEAQVDFKQVLQLALSLENVASEALELQGITMEVDSLTCPTQLGEHHMSVGNHRASCGHILSRGTLGQPTAEPHNQTEP